MTYDDLTALEARVRKECQFPPGERIEPYQDFYLPGAPGARRAGPLAGWVQGSRRVHSRAEALGFHPQEGELVLDIGCQSGGFLQYAALLGARGVGLDHDPKYIACAQALRDAVFHDDLLSYRRIDVTQPWANVLEDLRAILPQARPRPDHLLLLSMEKHIGLPALLRLIDNLCAKRTYIETNAYPAGSGAKAEVEGEVLRRGGRYLGDSDDRNPRRLYVIER